MSVATRPEPSVNHLQRRDAKRRAENPAARPPPSLVPAPTKRRPQAVIVFVAPRRCRAGEGECRHGRSSRCRRHGRCRRPPAACVGRRPSERRYHRACADRSTRAHPATAPWRGTAGECRRSPGDHAGMRPGAARPQRRRNARPFLVTCLRRHITFSLIGRGCIRPPARARIGPPRTRRAFPARSGSAPNNTLEGPEHRPPIPPQASGRQAATERGG